MIEKQKKLLIVCAAVFAALLLAYLLFIRPLVMTEEPGEETEPLETLEGESVSAQGRYFMFPHVERVGIQSIKVTNEYGTYEFYRDDNGDFQIRGFEGTAYDLELFSALVTATGHTLAKVKVVDNASDKELAEYGLDKPQASWELTTTTGEVYKVYVGYDLLTGGGYYCMLEGRRSVYVLDSTMKSTVLQPIESLVSPVLLAGIEQSDYYTINKFTIMHGEEILFSVGITDPEKQQNPDALQENYMIHPDGYFPNTDLYYEVLYNLMALDEANNPKAFKGTHVVKLGPSDEDLKTYGLDNPAYSMFFEYKEAEIMVFFSEKQEDGFYYAISNLFPASVVSIPALNAYFLEYPLINWIQMYPFQQWITTVKSIEVVGSGADVKFELTHGKTEDDKALLDVKCSTGKVIPNAEVYNFRQFFKTLLSVAIQDYVPLTEAEIKALAVEKNCILTFTINELNGNSTVYKFYPYSSTGRRALMTVNGHGEFYVQTDLIEKIASDANKVLNDLDVDSYGKN